VISNKNDAFLEWATTYDGILRKVARTYAPPGEREDLHQDLLIAIWNAAPHYRGQAKASTFVYRVALNCALNWTRKSRRYQERHISLDDTEIPPASLAAGAPACEQERRVERLYAALAMLAEGDRSLALLHLEDVSHREIAEVLGITENHVAVKLSRLKKRLAERLLQIENEGKEKGQ
jgi:RNA polymerase sigma-70 factor (ECF subfamily)